MSTAPVLIAAGGTGGHIVPALAVAEVLAARGVPVVWIGTRTGLEARMVPAAGIDIRWIDITGLRGKGLVDTVSGPPRLVRACLQSLALVRSLRPRAVLGMGGFVSGPVGLAALALRRPLVLHEQNAVPGLTNRRLARFASHVFGAWPGAFPERVGARVVGNPVRRDVARLAARAEPASRERATVGAEDGGAPPLRVLVVGGSRGARVLNETVPAAVRALGLPLRVRHQTGAAEEAAVRARYAGVSTETAEITVEPFIEDMAAAYLGADVVVCRSGAMTVTELAALGMPSILVPYPHAVDDHQSANARHLADTGAAVLMPQPELTPDTLAAVLGRLAGDRATLARMGVAARDAFRAGAAEAVADALTGEGVEEGAARGPSLSAAHARAGRDGAEGAR